MADQLRLWGFDKDGNATIIGNRIIYVFDTEKFYKIGTTTQRLKKRKGDLQTGCPFEMTLLGSFATGSLADEKRLLARLRKFRVRGEWFRKCPELTQIIQRLINPQSGLVEIVIPPVVPDDTIRTLNYKCPFCQMWGCLMAHATELAEAISDGSLPMVRVRCNGWMIRSTFERDDELKAGCGDVFTVRVKVDPSLKAA